MSMEAIRIRSQDPYVFQVEEYYKKAEADAEIKRLKYKLLELSNIAHATHKKSDYYDMIENLKLIEHEANIFSL